jgi:hypothetical protein
MSKCKPFTFYVSSAIITLTGSCFSWISCTELSPHTMKEAHYV